MGFGCPMIRSKSELANAVALQYQSPLRNIVKSTINIPYIVYSRIHSTIYLGNKNNYYTDYNILENQIYRITIDNWF